MDGDPSTPAGVMHWIISGTAMRMLHGLPPISTVVDLPVSTKDAPIPSADPPTSTGEDSLVSQKPLPEIVIFCPPYKEPVSGEMLAMFIWLVSRPVLLRELPWPSTLMITSYCPAGKAGGVKVREVVVAAVTVAS
jgi:hypothetical protein